METGWTTCNRERVLKLGRTEASSRETTTKDSRKDLASTTGQMVLTIKAIGTKMSLMG